MHSSPSSTDGSLVRPCDLRILSALRQIMRAVDTHSRKLVMEYRISGPQLLCLGYVVEAGVTTVTEISKAVHLSASTVVGILDRLEAKGWIMRQRDQSDRRLVRVTATETGKALCVSTPSPLQVRLAEGLASLHESEQGQIAEAVEMLVSILDAERIEAAPILESGPIEPTV